MAELGDLGRPACLTKDASKLFTIEYRSERESLAICSKTSFLVAEQQDEREAGRRYFSQASMAALYRRQNGQENHVEEAEEVPTE